MRWKLKCAKEIAEDENEEKLRVRFDLNIYEYNGLMAREEWE